MSTKNEKIKQSILATKERRLSQVCKTYEVKFTKSKLGKGKLNFLNRLFLEAKWLYNYQLSTGDIFSIPDNIKEVTVLNKDRLPEQRELTTLSSQMKQELVNRTKVNIISLSKLKVLGKSGKLKYKSRINSIPLKQYNQTYKLVSKNYIKIQGYKKPFKVKGLSQIPKDIEYTRASLVRRCGDYYLKITCYLPKESKITTGGCIGLDFGIQTSITTSDGDKYNYCFEEPKQLKKASRRLHKRVKGSKNRYKQKCKLNKQYQKLNNKKKDAINKFISKLVKENDLICIQDESIHQWKSSKLKGFGKRVHHSIMGGIISSLKTKPETLIIDRYYPSTQLCPVCGNKNKHTLDERIYVCSCGYQEDRDIHAARNILSEGLRISRGPRNPMPVERITTTYLDSFDLGMQVASVKQETNLN